MRKSLLLLLSIWLLAGCGRSRPAPSATRLPDTLLTEAAIMDLGQRDLPAALGRIDMGAEADLIPELEADRLRAKLIFQYSEDYDTAMEWCEKALRTRQARQDPKIRLELLRLAQSIAQVRKDLPTLMDIANEGRTLAHSLGEPVSEYKFDFSVGRTMYNSGADEEGFRRMEEAVNGALPHLRKEADYGDWITMSGNLCNSYLETERWQELLTLSARQEAVLATMVKTFPGTSPAWQERTRYYSLINQASARYRLGETEKAAELFNTALTLSYAATDDGISRQMRYFAITGQPEQVLACLDKVPYTGKDTVDRRYRLRLARLAEAYRNSGDIRKADGLEERMASLSQQIEAREREKVLTQIIDYQTLDYRLRVSDINRNLRWNSWLLAIMVLVILSLLAVGIVQFVHYRKRTQQIEDIKREDAHIRKEIGQLRKEMSLHQKGEGIPAGPSVSLTRIFEEKQLYLDKNMSRTAAAQWLDCSQRELSRMLEAIEPGMSFPRFINDLRIRHACDLMQQDPALTLAQIADNSGFYSTRTFQRTFQATLGKTPSEYRASLSSKQAKTTDSQVD